MNTLYRTDTDTDTDTDGFDPLEPIIPLYVLKEIDIRGYVLYSPTPSDNEDDYESDLALIYDDNLQSGWAIVSWESLASNMHVIWSTHEGGLFNKSVNTGSFATLLALDTYFAWPLSYEDVEPKRDLSWFRGF